MHRAVPASRFAAGRIVTLVAAKVRERLWGLFSWRLDPTGADFGRGEAILDEDADAREMHPEADASALL